jgi:hypothetical protein
LYREEFCFTLSVSPTPGIFEFSNLEDLCFGLILRSYKWVVSHHLIIGSFDFVSISLKVRIVFSSVVSCVLEKFDRHVNFSDRMNLHHLEFRVVRGVFFRNLRQLCCFCRCFCLRIWRSLQLGYDNPKVRELPRLATYFLLFFRCLHSVTLLGVITGKRAPSHSLAL